MSASGARPKRVPAIEIKEFTPGQLVVHSGVYRIRHHRHRFSHEATLLAGEQFPHCRYCGAKVKFRLVRAADRIELDFDFEHHPRPVLVRN
jgi:hypothetical protein